MTKQLIQKTARAALLVILLGAAATKAQGQSTLFNDTYWLFGRDWTGPGCPGIVFKKDNTDTWKPEVMSGVGQVRSWENSLSVSTPSCDGGFIFYTSHDQVYNTNHQLMEGGSFSGHQSVADGLAACYIGSNKYMLITTTTAYEGSWANIGLKAYIVDMSANNGLGKMTPFKFSDEQDAIQNGSVSESIELVPVTGTTDEYWLIFYAISDSKMHIYKIEGRNGNPTITADATSSVAYTRTGNTYNFKSNATYSRIALADAGKFTVFSFNPSSGALAIERTINLTAAGTSYGVEFSPNGRYLYLSGYDSPFRIYQYDLSTGVLNTSTYITYNSSYGGGMKRGPDGKIYVARWGTQYVGVIENPNNPIGSITYNPTGVDVKVVYNNLSLSTGITPPSKDPVKLENPPITEPDNASTLSIWPKTVNVLANDQHVEGSRLYLASAYLTNPAMSGQGAVSFNRATGDITFTPNGSHPFTDGEEVSITYTAQDNRTPIPMCKKELLTIKVYQPKLSLKLTSTNVDEGQSVTASVCLPGDVKANDAVTVSATVVSATDAADAADITPIPSATIAVGNTCATITITAKSDKLLEGNEALGLLLQATGFTMAASQPQITINDRTSGVVEIVKVSDADEGIPSLGRFRVQLADSDVKPQHKRVEVVVSFNGSADPSGSYQALANPMTLYIPKNQNSVDFTVTPINNYRVEGNREVVGTISSTKFEGT